MTAPFVRLRVEKIFPTKGAGPQVELTWTRAYSNSDAGQTSGKSTDEA